MSKLRISSRQIAAFVSVAECNSFTAAANRLDLTTSAVSSLIAELENVIGVRLFERSTRKVVLNNAGRLFLPTALAFSRQHRSVERVAETLGRQSNGTIRIAAPMVIASTILPKIMAEFLKKHGDSDIVILETGVEWLGERVAQGEADLAIGPDRATDGTVNADEIMPSKWVVWLSPDHRLAEYDVLKWRDLRGERFYTGGHDHERIMEQAMAGLPEDQQITEGQVFDNISTALGMAAANMGVTLCPAYVAPMARSFGLVMRHLVDPEFTRYVMLYSSSQRPLSDIAKAFAAHLHTHFANAANVDASENRVLI